MLRLQKILIKSMYNGETAYINFYVDVHATKNMNKCTMYNKTTTLDHSVKVLMIKILHKFEVKITKIFYSDQAWKLALARSPMRVSGVSGEYKSAIARPFGEYDFYL